MRITVPLDQQELQALASLARANYRPARDQARVLIREALAHAGLLSPEGKKATINEAEYTSTMEGSESGHTTANRAD